MQPPSYPHSSPGYTASSSKESLQNSFVSAQQTLASCSGSGPLPPSAELDSHTQSHDMFASLSVSSEPEAPQKTVPKTPAKPVRSPSNPESPLGLRKEDSETFSERSIPSHLSFTPKAEIFTQNHIMSPIMHLSNATDSHDFLQHTLGPCSVSLVSTDKVLELYGRNAKKIRDPEVQFSYAQILVRNGLTMKPDDAAETKKRKEYLLEAHDLLKRSSRGGCVDAQYFLGDSYAVGMFGKSDDSKALSYFEAAGKARHAEGAYRTAVCYRKGWGCSPDSRKVVKFLEIAALNNHPVAMMEYGIYCFKGLMGLPDDIITKRQGISWLKRATEVASELSCGAPYELGMIFLNGFRDIVIQDTKYAIKLFFHAASLGHAKSASLLGKLYEVGKLVEPNADLSIHFYNMAASSGDVDGMMGLCSWYFVGSDNLKQDYDEAFAWALRAAGCGMVKAMLLLQRFYELGIGCEKDLAKARCWADLAKRSANMNSERKRRTFD
ncbi:hypothetical protein KL905_004160 [Ogataea polymorpha]|nr:hypothetical protein KL907_003729 [Ogataea polymorpha]KAG7907316.1 hypothetical protein KL906_004003 [Ogataea polymorpha]KAG7915193.1 hypothetical protein KL927_004182 [Ogataea polymorpha]KAG7918081.1 hypothetical protein KL905_004160 [Ogataea polymorpha]KAG7933705.1 hypothetical protein KL904_003965 [Ogataea polymorpha]